jgi:ubiquinone/menaquinone biosynthesis C-methylase UbiE
MRNLEERAGKGRGDKVLSYVFMKILEGCPRSYDRRMDRVSCGRVRTLKKAVAAQVTQGERVLEIGCGTGELAEMLVERGATVEGFDLNPAMISEARERIEKRGLGGKLIIRQMGVDDMDGLPSAAFDVVVSTLVLSELSPDERRFVLKHVARVLRPGGRIVIADEVVPRTRARCVLHAVLRAPAAALTYLVASGTSRPIKNLAGDLARAGFIVQLEERARGGAFALVVAGLTRRREG